MGQETPFHRAKQTSQPKCSLVVASLKEKISQKWFDQGILGLREWVLLSTQYKIFSKMDLDK